MLILHTISTAAPLRPVLASRRASHGVISSPVLNVEYRRQSFPVLQISAQNSNLLRGFPDDFAFKVIDPTSSISLVREYQGKSIEVAASKSGHLKREVHMRVNISKGIQYDLLFSLEASDDGLIKFYRFEMRDEALKAFEKFLKIRGIKPSVTNVLLDHIRKVTENLKFGKDDHQVQGANKDISSEYYINLKGFPDDFPFKFIEVSEKGRLWPLDNDLQKRTLILWRMFQNREILVEVAKAYQNDVKKGVPMTFWDKEMCQFMEWTAYPDHIDIHLMVIRHTESVEYNKFLETRGINSSMIKFLLDYFYRDTETPMPSLVHNEV